MKTLSINNLAPDFTHVDMEGRKLRLSDYKGKKVLLSFFRFATCPFCTVRFARLSQEARQYSDMGIQIIAVFESSPEYIQEYLGNRSLPFPVIADPDGVLYASYGVKKSLFGMMLGMFRMPSLIRLMFDRNYKMAKPDSSIIRIPADFLIGTNQQIEDAYYGRDIGDHIPFHRIDRFAKNTAPMSAEQA